MRELSVQSASDTIGTRGREFSDKEFQHLVQEIDRIAGATEFNGRKLLNGEGEQAEIQIGIDADPVLSRLSYNTSETDVRVDSLGLSGMNIESKVSAQDSLAMIDNAIDTINGNRAGLGALQSRLGSTVKNLQISKENLSSANSQIRDADVAEETTELARSNILTNSTISVLVAGQYNPRKCPEVDWLRRIFRNS